MENSKKLFKDLDNLTWPADIKVIEATVKAAREIELELCEVAKFSADYYTRTLVYESGNFDAIVLTWKPRQRSPLHNHKGSACVVRVLKGCVTETIYERSASGMLYPKTSAQFVTGRVVSSWDEDIHQMSNLGTEDLVTLHIYAPGLKQMEIFSLTDTCLERYDELVSKSYTAKTENRHIN